MISEHTSERGYHPDEEQKRKSRTWRTASFQWWVKEENGAREDRDQGILEEEPEVCRSTDTQGRGQPEASMAHGMDAAESDEDEVLATGS